MKRIKAESDMTPAEWLAIRKRARMTRAMLHRSYGFTEAKQEAYESGTRKITPEDADYMRKVGELFPGFKWGGRAMKRMLRRLAVMALAVSLAVCFLMLVGSSYYETPVRDIVLLAAYCASGAELFRLLVGRHWND